MLYSSRAADEPAGWCDFPDVDPVDVGRTSRARLRHRPSSRRLLRAFLQRFSSATERARHDSAAGRLVSTGRSDARHGLSYPCLSEIGGSRGKREHTHHTSSHSRLRSVKARINAFTDKIKLVTIKKTDTESSLNINNYSLLFRWQLTVAYSYCARKLYVYFY